MDLKNAMNQVEGMVETFILDRCVEKEYKNKCYEAVDTVLEACKFRLPEPVKYIGEYAVCPKCNKVVGSKAKFCKECGQRVVREE